MQLNDLSLPLQQQLKDPPANPEAVASAIERAEEALNYSNQRARKEAAARLLKALMPNSNRAARRAALLEMQRKAKRGAR